LALRSQLRILHDIEHNAARLDETDAAEGSGDDLIVTKTRAKKMVLSQISGVAEPGSKRELAYSAGE
jgi:hypothetical protein